MKCYLLLMQLKGVARNTHYKQYKGNNKISFLHPFSLLGEFIYLYKHQVIRMPFMRPLTSIIYCVDIRTYCQEERVDFMRLKPYHIQGLKQSTQNFNVLTKFFLFRIFYHHDCRNIYTLTQVQITWRYIFCCYKGQKQGLCLVKAMY